MINPNADAATASGLDHVKAVMFGVLAKRSDARMAFMEVAHHAIDKMTGGAVCKGQTCEKGARHSAETLGKLQDAHGHLVAAGFNHNPVPAVSPTGQTQGTANSAAKAAGEGGDLTKMADDLANVTASRDALQKVVGELAGKLDVITKRLETVEAQPLPAKTLGPDARLPDGVRAVEKGHEGDAGGATQITDAEVLKRVAAMSEDEKALLLIKANFRNPGSQLQVDLRRG
jgi:hypothetical protein